VRPPPTTEQNAAASAGAERARRAQPCYPTEPQWNLDPRLRRSRPGRKEHDHGTIMARPPRRPICSGWAAAACTG
jgi:hypothetical protein